MGTNWADRTEEQRETAKRKAREKRARRTPEQVEAERRYMKRYQKRLAFKNEVQAAMYKFPYPSNSELMVRFGITYDELQKIKNNHVLPDSGDIDEIMGLSDDSLTG